MNQQSFTISHIVAASLNNVIGFKNKLPWNIPEDLKFFKEKTLNRTIIMGRKTFESLGQPLPNRLNIVVSSNKGFQPAGVEMKSSIEQALKTAKQKSLHKEIFIIGGGEIYKQSLPQVQKIYLTRIHKNFHGDAFYPQIPEDEFQLASCIDREGPPPFSFLTYVRKKS